MYISLFEPNVALGKTINLPLLKLSALIVPTCPAALPNFIVPKSKGPLILIVPLFCISTLSIYAFGPFIVMSPASSLLEPSSLLACAPETFRFIVPLLLFFITPPVPAKIPVPVELFTFIVPPILSISEPKSTNTPCAFSPLTFIIPVFFILELFVAAIPLASFPLTLIVPSFIKVDDLVACIP